MKITITFDSKYSPKGKIFDMAVDHYYKTWGKDNNMTKRDCRKVLEDNPGLVISCIEGIVG